MPLEQAAHNSTEQQQQRHLQATALLSWSCGSDWLPAVCHTASIGWHPSAVLYDASGPHILCKGGMWDLQRCGIRAEPAEPELPACAVPAGNVPRFLASTSSGIRGSQGSRQDR